MNTTTKIKKALAILAILVASLRLGHVVETQAHIPAGGKVAVACKKERDER